MLNHLGLPWEKVKCRKILVFPMGRAFSTAIGIAKAALLMLHNSEWPNQEIRIGDALGNLFPNRACRSLCGCLFC